jgi:hypothetical protein
MTGWSTISIKPDTESHEGFGLARMIQDKLIEHSNEHGLHTDATRYHGCVVAMIGGYRDWNDDVEVLQSLSQPWEKAVICQANDTSDVGHAKYYEPAQSNWHRHKENEPVCIDEFKENELCHGRPVGAKACAYMTLHHGVYILSSLKRPGDFRMKKSELAKEDE